MSRAKKACWRSADRFDSVGCKMVPNNEWPQAPLDVPIFGLKELEVSEYATYSRHSPIHR